MRAISVGRCPFWTSSNWWVEKFSKFSKRTSIPSYQRLNPLEKTQRNKSTRKPENYLRWIFVLPWPQQVFVSLSNKQTKNKPTNQPTNQPTNWTNKPKFSFFSPNNPITNTALRVRTNLDPRNGLWFRAPMARRNCPTKWFNCSTELYGDHQEDPPLKKRRLSSRICSILRQRQSNRSGTASVHYDLCKIVPKLVHSPSTKPST